MQPRQSLVARQALSCIEQIRAADFAAEYRTRALSFPAMILQSGLAQGFGFLLEKSGNGNPLERAYDAYARHLLAVVRAGWPTLPGDLPHFQQDIIAADLARYRRLTRATLDGAVWIKSLAQAHLQTS